MYWGAFFLFLVGGIRAQYQIKKKKKKKDYGLQVLRPGWNLSIQLLYFTEEEAKAMSGFPPQVHVASSLELV